MRRILCLALAAAMTVGVGAASAQPYHPGAAIAWAWLPPAGTAGWARLRPATRRPATGQLSPAAALGCHPGTLAALEPRRPVLRAALCNPELAAVLSAGAFGRLQLGAGGRRIRDDRPQRPCRRGLRQPGLSLTAAANRPFISLHSGAELASG